MIQVTAELLRAKAGELRNMRGEHDEVMNRMRIFRSSPALALSNSAVTWIIIISSFLYSSAFSWFL